MFIFSGILFALAVTYSVVLVRFTAAFRTMINTWKPRHHVPAPSVTVIVPARNEASTVGGCIASLLKNDYPGGVVTIVVVDDDSEDETPEVVSTFVASTDRLRLLRLRASEGDRLGKRSAITKAIADTSGDLILLTDADSEVPPAWIRTMVSAFDPQTRFVAGPVAYRGGSDWFGRLLELELLGLVAVGAGAISTGHPNMCNGANVAFRRASFLEIGGYAAIDGLASGDDELLMQRMGRLHHGSVRFCPDPAALVITQSPENLGSLFQQRRRWASKGLHYPEKRTTLLALLVYAFNLSLLVGFAASLVTTSLWPALSGAIVLKIGAEGWMFWSVCDHFGRKHLLPEVVTGQLFEIPYVVAAGAAGVFGGYRWKGRKIKR